ncbi:hypothetical protein SKAU_G00320180 [Synaphobranchus kaupii]|uniref:BTB domain-containing protein n=1 Tax=Synaphobranchus kaupii TaxID=118154 RepID=A0A9Q1IIS3_SYNKA|nr:hypothetical protein SKAU_G00320180 [Synaphobranchus kaupii]
MWLWRRDGFEQQLLCELQRQQRCSLFCDTVLQADGISVPAHSCVLAALSPALGQVLCSGPAPPAGRSRLLELQAVGAEPLLRLVGFLYSGRLEGESPAQREQLLQAAACLGIQGLLEERSQEEGEERRRGEGEEGPGTDRGTQTDCAVKPDAGLCPLVFPEPPHSLAMTSPFRPTLGRTPPRPPASHTPCPTMPSGGGDDYFTLSSSAAPGLAGVSPAKGGEAPAAVAMEIPQPAVCTVAHGDDVMAAAPPMGCASALAALASGPGSVAPSPADTSGPAVVGATHVGPDSLPSADRESRGGTVLVREGGAGRGSSKRGRTRSQGMNPSSIEEGKVGRMRSSGMKGRSQGRGVAAGLRARQRDRQISIKIRLRRQSKSELWEIVSVREEGVASTPRGRCLRRRQNPATFGRISRNKDGLPVVKRQRGLSMGTAVPQRLFRDLSLNPPSTVTSPPPHKPHPLLPLNPAHSPVPLPPAPSIPEDMDEQIEKLLDDIMMGLNILPPIVVETDSGGHGDSKTLHPSPGDFGMGASGPCPYQCPQSTGSARPETGFSCPSTQDGGSCISGPGSVSRTPYRPHPPPVNCQLRYTCSQETAYPRVPQQTSDVLHNLDHFLWSREGHPDGAWERSAAGHSDGGGGGSRR